jgi:hypothetical protein
MSILAQKENWKQEADKERGRLTDSYARKVVESFMQRVLARIVSQRHGGTVFLVPRDWTVRDQRMAEHLTVKHPVLDLDMRKLLVEDRVADIASRAFRRAMDAGSPSGLGGRTLVLASGAMQASGALRNSIDLVGAFANVDGAVVITDQLRVLGFGAEVVSVNRTLREILRLRPNGKRGSRITLEEFGTRHRSAARACASVSDVVAFVVSQDGALRVCHREKSDVVMWPDIDVDAWH